jgi:hypothetical protein
MFSREAVFSSLNVLTDDVITSEAVFSYLNVLIDDVFTREAVFFLNIFGVAEHTVSSIEVVVGPPEQGRTNSHSIPKRLSIGIHLENET